MFNFLPHHASSVESLTSDQQKRPRLKLINYQVPKRSDFLQIPNTPLYVWLTVPAESITPNTRAPTKSLLKNTARSRMQASVGETEKTQQNCSICSVPQTTGPAVPVHIN